VLGRVRYAPLNGASGYFKKRKEKEEGTPWLNQTREGKKGGRKKNDTGGDVVGSRWNPSSQGDETQFTSAQRRADCARERQCRRGGDHDRKTLDFKKKINAGQRATKFAEE